MIPKGKRMKRFLALLLAVVCMLSVFGCGKKSTLGDDSLDTNADGTVKELKSKDMYNFLVMGHDRQASLTDVVMLVSYDTKEGTMAIMQLPRDTYIEVENNTYHKLNGLYNHCVAKARDEESTNPQRDGCRKAADYLADALGIKIHYSAVMDLDGFGAIVDAIGGVYMYVPYTLEYSDSSQNLNIDLQEGYNTLDGDEAEQFVRYRSGFANADIGRGDAQKMFMTAFLESFKKNVSISNIGEIANAIVKNVETDMKLRQIIKIGTSLISIELSDITMMTLPGEACMSGGVSYYVMNKELLCGVLSDHFNIYVDELSSESVDKNSIFCNENDSNMLSVYEKPGDEVHFEKHNAQDISDEDIYIPLK